MLKNVPDFEPGSLSEVAGMNRSRRFALRARWAIPVGAVAAVAMVIAGSAIAGAQASPALPARTAAQLLADIASATAPPSSLSGVIVESASLGLPQLPDIGGATSGYSLLAGTHTIKFWAAGPARVRIAIPATLGESDIRRDGRQVWLWDSSSQTATHIVLPARSGPGPAAGGAPMANPALRALTPQQAARQVLAAVGPTTTVSVQQNIMIAGQAAYQLAIAPKDSRSLIGQVRIAVDAHGYLPLRLQVFARGATSPAYQVGYTALSFAEPAASNFTFTPPPGAKVKNVSPPRLGGTGFGAAPPVGLPAGSFYNRAPLRNQPKSLILPAPRAGGADRALRRAELRQFMRLRKSLPKGMTAAQRLAAAKSLRKELRIGPGAIGPGGLPSGTPRPGAPQPGAGPAPAVIGRGWLSVIVLPLAGSSSSAAALSGTTFSEMSQQPSSSYAFAELTPEPSSSNPSAATAVSSAYTVTVSVSTGQVLKAPPGEAPKAQPGAGPIAVPSQDLAVLRALLRAATPVHGSWGSGRLLRTSLLSVLLVNKGHVLIGAVTPSVLYADAAKVK